MTERQGYILRVRTLARSVAEAYFNSRAEKGFPLATEANRAEVLAKYEAAKAKKAVLAPPLSVIGAETEAKCVRLFGHTLALLHEMLGEVIH